MSATIVSQPAFSSWLRLPRLMSTASTSTPWRNILRTAALPMPLPAPVTIPRRCCDGGLIRETPSSRTADRAPRRARFRVLPHQAALMRRSRHRLPTASFILGTQTILRHCRRLQAYFDLASRSWANANNQAVRAGGARRSVRAHCCAGAAARLWIAKISLCFRQTSRRRLPLRRAIDGSAQHGLRR